MPPKRTVLRLESLALALEAKDFRAWLGTYPEAEQDEICLWLISRLAEKGLAPAPPEGIHAKPQAEKLAYVEELNKLSREQIIKASEAIRELKPLYEQAKRVPELRQK